MRKQRKSTVLVVLCMAFMALAIPATASATSLWTQESWEEEEGPVPKGQLFEMHSQSAGSWKLETSWGSWYCSDAKIMATVIRNNGAFEAVGAPGSSVSGCSTTGVGSSYPYIFLNDLKIYGEDRGNPGELRTAGLSFNIQTVLGLFKYNGELEVSFKLGGSTLQLSGEMLSAQGGEGWLTATLQLSEPASYKSPRPLFLYPWIS